MENKTFTYHIHNRCKDFIYFSAISIEELQEIQRSPIEPFNKPYISLTLKEIVFLLIIGNNLSKSTIGQELLKTAEHLQYQFGGFGPSKGRTDPYTRVINIRETSDYNTATLTLAYELSNVINAPKYIDIFTKARNCKLNAAEYANQMIRLEAEAIYWRSLVANELNLLHLVLNPNYNRIALTPGLPVNIKR